VWGISAIARGLGKSAQVFGIDAFAFGGEGNANIATGIRVRATGAKTNIGIDAGAGLGEDSWAGRFRGNVHIEGMLTKTSGTFLIDHPLDPENKTLSHSLVESPESLCLYRGKVRLDPAGTAKVRMPDYFAALTKEDEATVTLTPIGSKPFTPAYEWNSDFTEFTIYGEADREVSYLVLADRDDPAAQLFRRPVEEEKGKGHCEKGKLLCPEAYGQAAEELVGVSPRSPRSSSS